MRGAKYASDAEIVITNENVFDRRAIDDWPALKLIALTSTRTNSVDVDYCNQKCP
jgi:lactate dehydrogenase-like 2-hydroxyacid dehydrogenase